MFGDKIKYLKEKNGKTPAAGWRPALDEGLQTPNDTTEKLDTDRQHSDAKTEGDPGHNIS